MVIQKRTILIENVIMIRLNTGIYNVSTTDTSLGHAMHVLGAYEGFSKLKPCRMVSLFSLVYNLGYLQLNTNQQNFIANCSSIENVAAV